MSQRMEWDESYSVGHGHMDTHHQNLVRIINRLVDLDETIKAEAKVSLDHKMEYMKCLTSISNYVNLHFSVEESLLQSVNYPHINDQARDHIRYMDRIADFVVAPDVAQLEQVTAFLGEWILNHIKVEDMKYKPYVQQA